MGKTSTASKNKWNAQNYDQLRVVVRKGKKNEYKLHAQSKGMSLNAYIISLIEADIKKEEQGE